MIQPIETIYRCPRLAADRRDNFIKVAVGKSCYLLLTWEEYVKGLQRGKRERRSLRMAQSGAGMKPPK